jgi:zinc transporter ZupT
LANAVAAGLMLGASHGLINEGIFFHANRVFIGIALGLVFMVLMSRLLGGHDHVHIGELSGASALKAILIVSVMTIHSFSEGIGVGVSFGGEENLGELISIAIAIHNIPEGLAISVVLVPRGVSPWKAMLWSIVSSLPQPLMAVPAFLFVTAFKDVLPIGLGFAAGAMIWMVFAEIIPDALKDASRKEVAAVVTVALSLMIWFQLMLVG